MPSMIENGNNRDVLSTRNKRLATILGVFAVAIYGGYIIAFYFIITYLIYRNENYSVHRFNL